jgi:hypothetical protein
VTCSALRPPSAERAEVIHTLEIDVMAVPERSDNNGVDLDRVDNWPGCFPRLLRSPHGAAMLSDPKAPPAQFR